MKKTKGRKVSVAMAVACSLLLFILICVLIYQTINIVNAKSLEDKLKKEIAKMEQIKAETDDEIAYKSSAYYREKLAREYGIKND